MGHDTENLKNNQLEDRYIVAQTSEHFHNIMEMEKNIRQLVQDIIRTCGNDVQCSIDVCKNDDKIKYLNTQMFNEEWQLELEYPSYLQTKVYENNIEKDICQPYITRLLPPEPSTVYDTSTYKIQQEQARINEYLHTRRL